MSLPTPNYKLTETVHVNSPSTSKTITLEAGTFVRPIEDCYLPAHIVDSTAYKWAVKGQDVFCYTSLGIVPIAWSKIRKT